MSQPEKNFLDLHKEGLEHIGFWEEQFKSSFISMYMTRYKTEVIRNYTIVDFVVKDTERILVKWVERREPLTDEEIMEKWNRDVSKGE